MRWPVIGMVVSIGLGCSPAPLPPRLDAAAPPRPVDAPSIDAPMHAQTLEHLHDATALMHAFAWGFGLALAQLPPEGVPSGAQAREMLTVALMGERFVVDGACASTEWTGARTARVTLTDCVLALTGEAISGVLILEVVGPAGLLLSFEALSSGDVVVGGTARVWPVPDGNSGARTDALMRYFDGTTAVTLTLRSPYVYQNAGYPPVRTSLTGNWIGDGRIGAISADLSWNPGECLPFGQTFIFDGAPFTGPMQLFFWEMSPSLGVEVLPDVRLRGCL
jgi:hypothetical protein